MYQNVVFYRFSSITKRVKSGHILAERWELDTGAQVFQGAHELLVVMGTCNTFKLNNVNELE